MDQLKPSSAKHLIQYFFLAFAFSWFFWLWAVLSSLELLPTPIPNFVWVMVGAHGPLFASLFLTYRSGGWEAVKQLIRSGFNLRMKVKWWFAIILIPVVLTAISVWLSKSLNNYQMGKSLLQQPLLIVPMILFMFFLGGSFQEEYGWRGYALPKLLERMNPITASLILGGIWGIWHLPLFFIADTSQSFMPFSLFFLLAVAMSVLFTFFYLKTDRNLFSALLFHTAVNTSLSLFPTVEQKIGGSYTAMIYLLIAYFCISILIVGLDFSFWKNKAA